MKAWALIRRIRSGLVSSTVLGGVLIGFGACCGLGRLAARHNHLTPFTRFTQWTSPETNYYPTANEMMSLVRTRMKPGQILVLIGGNSILRGAGQPAGRVWSEFLQTRLGPRYCVVNFAFDGSGITDAASVVAEALRNEFPRQIYLANAAPGQPPSPDGTGVYRFVFWDAFYKGLLIDDAVRAAAIADTNQNPDVRNPAGAAALHELQIREWMDHYGYFQDLWNEVTFRHANLVWGFYMPGVLDFLPPRRSYRDPEPDTTTYPRSVRYPPGNLATEMLNVRGCSQFAYMSFNAAGHPQMQKDAHGTWPIYTPFWDQFKTGIAGAMPDILKPRTLILLSRSSPYYLQLLTPDERERDDLTYAHAVEVWKASGYEAMDYGRDFTVDEYGDRTHLTWPGGARLAGLVSDKIREMARHLGYLPP
jgi:hypothetical protein